jgi:glucokinase
MVIVGDIGGTSTRLACAHRHATGVELDRVEIYDSRSAARFEDLLDLYINRYQVAPTSAAFGFPGPVIDRQVKTTNLPWLVSGEALEQRFGVRVLLLNDLEAAAWGLDVVPEDHRVVLQAGIPTVGNRAVIAAGTGLGEAFSLRHGNGWVICASEGGHTEFGPRDDEEIDLLRFLRQRHGHVSYERIVSGPGLVQLFEFYRAGTHFPEPWRTGEDQPAAIVRAAAEQPDSPCAKALAKFCEVYGAEAGNLALKSMAAAGVYLAGGIAAKLLTSLQHSRFLEAFRDKGRYRPLMERIPVAVVTDPYLALRGAAVALD